MPTPAHHLCVGFDGNTVPDHLPELIRRGVRAFILFSRNATALADVARLTAELRALSDEPILICVDHEGGDVQRFNDGFTVIPPMREVRDAEHAHAMGCTMGRELRAAGVDLNLAPVLDVDSNPANPVIGARAFSADPSLVADFACAVLHGLREHGVAACGKHFPGHGDTTVDSHLELPTLHHGRERLNAIELPPFRAAIAAGIPAIMTAHIVFSALDPTQPATLSPAVIDGLLRRDLGFDGVVISDDLEMEAIAHHHDLGTAAVQSLAAGVDLLLCCHSAERQHQVLDALDDAVRGGTLSASQMAASSQRLAALW